MGASVIKKGRKALFAKKVGMTQFFQEDGVCVPVTVLEVGPCTVLQVKDGDRDGYSSLQIGFGDTGKAPRRPQQGHFRKAGVNAKRLVREIPTVGPEDVSRVPLRSGAGGTVEFKDLTPGENVLESVEPKTGLISRTTLGAGDEDGGAIVVKDSSGSAVEEHALPAGASIEVNPGDTVAEGDLLAYVPASEAPESVAPGMQICVGLFKDTQRVDVRGLTKGRGFSGCIKRHNFNAGDKGHGSKNVREPGSTGMHTDPGRVFKGKPLPGQHGMEQRKIRRLSVVEIDESRNLMLVKGAVPGPTGGYLLVQESLS